MIRSLYTGESGLKGHQIRMDVIGNNISNVNTVGYKSSRATFEDMLSQNMKGASASNGGIGSANPKQVGLGTQVSRIDLIFRDGAPVTTGKNTDLSLSGDGLFVVKRGNETYYTRDGAFEFDSAGNYVMPGSGHYVQGWMAKDGVIDTTGTTENIKITIGQPLMAVTDTGATITGISVATADSLDVAIGGKRFLIGNVPNDGKTWTFKDDVPLGATTAEIEDGNGNTRTVKFYPASMYEIPKGQDVRSNPSGFTKGSVTEEYPITVSLGGKQYTVIGMNNDYYRSNWVLKSGGATAGSNTITITDGTNDITFTLNAPLEESIGQMEVTTAIASAENPVTITYSDGTTAVKTDGTYAIGDNTPVVTTVATLQGIQIDSSGIITGIYTNGERRPEAQVAMAHFNNSSGLVKTGTSLYQESANSGIPTIIRAGEYGTVITPGTLEMSNVDVANEFSDMIITQRGFQSNAKIITVGDEMIETAVNMKR